MVSGYSKLKLGIILAACLSMLGVFLQANNRPLVAAQADCKSFVVIYARGSGQDVGQGEEKAKLYSEISKHVSFDDGDFVELSAQDMPNEYGYDYEAEAVVGSLSAIWNGIEANVTRGGYGTYKSSVREGGDLLAEYLRNSNFLECGTKIALAGYSQGAHVITESLFDRRLANYLPQISFVATFGDPSLEYLAVT